MRSLLALSLLLVLAVPARADPPAPQGRSAVSECVDLVRGKINNAGDPGDAAAEEGAQAQLDRVGREAGIAFESCIGVVATPCQAAPGGESTAGMTQCFDRETAAWDERLNANYKTRLADATNEYGDALKKMQRAWIAYRDAKCSSIHAEFEGTMAIPLTASCMLTETARQAIFLEPE